MNIQEHSKIITKLYNKIKNEKDFGEVARYIPELAKIKKEKFGVFLTTINNEKTGIGDFNTKFSLQSISKVLTLTLAYSLEGDEIWKRVGVEPSGNPFNSLVQLEADHGIPRNPLINAGAMVICDILISRLNNPEKEFLKFVRNIAQNNLIDYSEQIAASEKAVGYRNIALCNFIKSFGNIHNEPDAVLDFYFKICSLEMSCHELSECFLYLADDNFRTKDNRKVLSLSQAKRINALMQTCGFYDESGEFTFKVGLPGKSGVGGGIIAIHPGDYSIAIWSPGLNKKGNSYRGVKFLEQFTTITQSSIF